MKIKDLNLIIRKTYKNYNDETVYIEYGNILEYLYDQIIYKKDGYFKNLEWEHFLNFKIDHVNIHEYDYDSIIVVWDIWSKKYTNLFLDNKFIETWFKLMNWTSRQAFINGIDNINYVDEHTIILKENYNKYFNNDN